MRKTLLVRAALAPLLAGIWSLTGCQGTASTAPSVPFASLDIADSSEPAPGLFCAGQPTPAQFARLKEAGITKVVSLRAVTETGTGFEEQAAAAQGLAFVRIPISGPDDVTVDNGKRLAAELAPRTLVYCHSSNRVGALLALKARFVDGLAPEAALEFGRSCGLEALEPVVRQRLAQ